MTFCCWLISEQFTFYTACNLSHGEQYYSYILIITVVNHPIMPSDMVNPCILTHEQLFIILFVQLYTIRKKLHISYYTDTQTTILLLGKTIIIIDRIRKK
jgi:hypothetical protein